MMLEPRIIDHTDASRYSKPMPESEVPDNEQPNKQEAHSACTNRCTRSINKFDIDHDPHRNLFIANTKTHIYMSHTQHTHTYIPMYPQLADDVCYSRNEEQARPE